MEKTPSILGVHRQLCGIQRSDRNRNPENDLSGQISWLMILCLLGTKKHLLFSSCCFPLWLKISEIHMLIAITRRVQNIKTLHIDLIWVPKEQLNLCCLLFTCLLTENQPMHTIRFFLKCVFSPGPQVPFLHTHLSSLWRQREQNLTWKQIANGVDTALA